MNRRQFAYWIGAGLFGLGERRSAESLDTLAAAVMQCTEKRVAGKLCIVQERWHYQEDETWRWFARETLVEDNWELNGRTTPVHRHTGERYAGETVYLDESLVPDAVRYGTYDATPHEVPDYNEGEFDESDYGEASDGRRAAAMAAPPANGSALCMRRNCDCGCRTSMCRTSASVA